MSDRHDLSRLAFSTIRCSKNFPVFTIANCVARIPEYRRHAGVQGILEESSDLALFDFPGDFQTEAKILAKVIDAPAKIGIHQNAVVR